MRAYRIIRTPEQYNEYSDIEAELAFSGKTDQETMDELELLVMLTERYMSEQRPMPEIDPIQYLRLFMKTHKMKAVGLAELLGIDVGYAEDMLNYRKGLSVEIILKLNERFNVLPDTFNRPYKLKSKYNRYIKDACVMNNVKELPQKEGNESQNNRK